MRRVKARRRPLKRHVQQELLTKDGTRPRGKTGGKQRRAGRPVPAGKRPSERHKVRPALDRRHPVHVVLRARPVVSSLRGFAIYHAIRAATIVAARKGACRIVHLSIQGTHLHLLVEADDRMALARGMQSFQISAAKQINRALGKERGDKQRGQVFADRYHAEVITCPRQARHALAYVLNNWRKHREDRGERSSSWLVDPFSTGGSFTGWQELADRGLAAWSLRAEYQPLVVCEPRTWLLREGWRRHGLIRCHEIPSARRPRAGRVQRRSSALAFGR